VKYIIPETNSKFRNVLVNRSPLKIFKNLEMLKENFEEDFFL